MLLDTILIFLCLYFSLRGLSRGFIGEVVSNIGFIASCYCTFNFFTNAGMILEALTGMNFFLANILGAIAIWILISIVAKVIIKLLQGAADSGNLGIIDKILGLACGMLKTILLVFLLMAIGVNTAYLISPDWMTKSVIMMRAGEYLPQVTMTLKDVKLLPPNATVPETTLADFVLNYNKETLKEKN